jgi:hypothetical protein
MQIDMFIFCYSFLEIWQLGRYKEALDFAIRSYQLDPSDSRLLDHVAQLRAKINAGYLPVLINFVF